MTPESDSVPGEPTPRRQRRRPGLIGQILDSLPGQLLMVTVGLIALGLVLVYFPATASFRVQWMTERTEAAHLAALAADVAPGGALGEAEVRALLMGADAVAVSRVRDGMNELILYSGPIGDGLVESDLRSTSWAGHVRDTIDTLTAPRGRLLRIRAVPAGYPDELIDVIVREAPLKVALQDFSGRLLAYAGLAALLVGAAVYCALFYLFVRPMRRLAAAMTRFREAPEDEANIIRPCGLRNEIGQAEEELALMQAGLRQALHQRERLAALGSAVAKINHDLRNVLASAQLVSDRLAEDEDERVRTMGQRLVRAVSRGIRLCQATLEFGRAEDSRPVRQAVIIADLLEDVAGDAAVAEAGIAWDNQVDTALELDVDPDHTHRLFLNLCRNAVQAMQGSDGPRTLLVHARSEDGFAVLEVCDTGPGLPAKARDNLFKAFAASTRRGGAGLGLSIAREIARSHGGDVCLVKSGPDGTVFEVKLPLRQAVA
ncbi:sensor histidine kinase [Maricaulis sp. CAU 1757]